jgi:hypothetical protein
MAYALGSETLDVLSRQSMGREELLAGLSQHLPDLINQLTPNGRLPTEKAARMYLGTMMAPGQKWSGNNGSEFDKSRSRYTLVTIDPDACRALRTWSRPAAEDAPRKTR